MAKENLQEIKEKAAKWDELEKQISACYFDADGNELSDDEGGDLYTIGEIAASAFGWI